MAKDRSSRPDHDPSAESHDPGIDFEDLSGVAAWSWDADEWPGIPETIRRMYVELMLRRGFGHRESGPPN
jgi:hypothetical protein